MTALAWPPAKDWATVAARRVHLLFMLNGIAPQDTSVPRVAAVIAEASGLRPDVAYMPVPRCDSCALWRRSSGVTGHAKAVGECGAADEVVPMPMFVVCAGRGTLLTRGDFGCVHHRGRG